MSDQETKSVVVTRAVHDLLPIADGLTIARKR